MDSGKNITVGELGEKITLLEQQISPWAKSGMRAYTKDELATYKVILALIDFLESKGFIDGQKMKAWLVSYSPTEHRTIKESRPINAKGDEVEVFEKILAKVLRGEGDMDDFSFIKEVEKRTGIEIFDEELRTSTIQKTMELKNIKTEIERWHPTTY